MLLLTIEHIRSRFQMMYLLSSFCAPLSFLQNKKERFQNYNDYLLFIILLRTWVVPCFSHALFGLEYLSWWEYLRRTEGTHILFWKIWFDIIDQGVELYCVFASYFPPKPNRRCERLVPTFGRLPQGWLEYPGGCFWY